MVYIMSTLTSVPIDHAIVSWVSVHGRSTITPNFSLPRALIRCTGRFLRAKPCEKFVGGVNVQPQARQQLDLDHH